MLSSMAEGRAVFDDSSSCVASTSAVGSVHQYLAVAGGTRSQAECLTVYARKTDWSPVSDAAGTEADVRREIDEIDATLRRLRGGHAGMDDTVGDRADAAADLTGYEEEQALVENLERRRAELTEQLEGK